MRYIKSVFSVVILLTSYSIFAQNVCWTTSTGNIGNSSIFTCSSGTTLSTADTLFVRHAVTIGASNNQSVNYSSYAFSVISLENNATIRPYGANNELTLPTFAKILVNSGSAIVQPSNQSQGTAINVPTNTSTVCVWGTKCCIGNQSINGPASLLYTNPCNFTVPLPVKLISFTGEVKKDVAVLNWQSTFEEDFKGYEVMKSIDGQNYQSIGQVEASKENSPVMSYVFEDSKLLQGNSFYKLKMNDNNGHSEFSNVVALVNENENLNNKISLYPNPANTNVTVELANASEHANLQFRIVDICGKVVYESDIQNTSESVFDVNIESLPKGVYMLHAYSDNGLIGISKILKN